MILKHNNHKIEVYDSVKDLPIGRFFQFNLNLKIDAEIGSDVNAFNTRLLTVKKLIKTDPESAITELENLRKNVQFIMQNISPKSRAFICMIKTIDGQSIPDELTEDIITSTLELLKQRKFKWYDIYSWVNQLKKKVDYEVGLFFRQSGRDEEKLSKFYMNLKKRSKLLLQEVYQGVSLKQQIDVIDTLLLAVFKPSVFGGRNGVEVQFTKAFEQSCILLAQKGLAANIKQAKELSVLEYYEALEVIRKQVKEANKRIKSKR